MFKKHMTPLRPGGETTVHKGKGSQMAGMPNRSQISQLASAPGAPFNNFAKATPMAQPAATPPTSEFPGGF